MTRDDRFILQFSDDSASNPAEELYSAVTPIEHANTQSPAKTGNSNGHHLSKAQAASGNFAR